MKYNKSNIITDRDIDLTSGDRSKTLGETLIYQQEQIDQLKSNVKWMYKYGALGSGAGGNGGGSSSTSFKVLVYKGEELVKSGTTLYYSSSGSYPIKVQILNGGTSTYKIQFSYDNGKTASSIVSASDGFGITRNFEFVKNSALNITVTCQDTQEVYEENNSPVLSFPYIVEAYSFSAYYVYGNNPNTTEKLEQYTPVNNSIFMSQMKLSGIMLALEYNIAVNINDSATELYYDTFEGNRITLRGNNSHISKGQGILYLPLANDILNYLSDNSNATYKHIELGVSITLESSINPEPTFTATFRDNLIPNGLYLKVNTSGGVMYNYSGVDSEMYNNILNIPIESRFNPGDIIFNITPYYDYQDKSRPYYGSVNVYDVIDGIPDTDPSFESQRIQLVDQETSRLIAQTALGGIKKLIFKLELGNEVVTYEYWINVNILESNFNWYPDSENIIPISNSYYRNGLEIKNVNGIERNKLIENNINSTISTITFDNIHNTQNIPISEINGIVDIVDIMMNLGIQYSKINDYENPIMSFNVEGSTSEEIGADSIFVYQDKVVITSGRSVIRNNQVFVGTVREQCEIFIPLSDKIDIANKDNYHLLSLYKKLENYEGNNYWKALYALIDGCMDGVISNFLSIHRLYNSVTFYPGNYVVNLVDISFWDHNPNNTVRRYLDDNDISTFWYTYAVRMISTSGSERFDTDAIYLYNSFVNDFYYDEDNYIHYKTDAVPSNVAQHINVPVVLLYFDDVTGNIGGGFSGRNKDNFKDFLNGRYDEEQIGIPEHIPVNLEYSAGLSELTEIKLPGTNSAARFRISIQGSSTRSFKAKNLELEAPIHEHPDTNVYVFSPNNNPDINDTESFLPEESFTLKADVVDSSHTNNNAMGLFVDENTRQFADASAEQSSIYINRLKNCLTGFPCLVFLHTKYYTDDTRLESKENRLFLGIYNFNLGRNSAFNMGYKNMAVLDEKIQNSEKGFKIFELTTAENALLQNIEVAEIQGNNPHFDFSQYDKSTLYKINNTNDKTYMWGDFVNNETNISTDTLKNNIASFVEKIALSGAYMFKRIQKIFPTSPETNYGYDEKYSAIDGNGNPILQVPNYRYQFVRTLTLGGQILTNYVDKGENDNASLLRNATNTIFNYYNEVTGTNIASLDFRSLAEYYTICMAFGLVDSVMKNLNIKSWNADAIKRWYIAFYDMDTSFGKTNAGTKMSYFAFSDYWRSKYTIDNTGNYKLEPVEIFRDWAPMQSNDASSFFDVPSTYLFAIAKYAYNILKIDLRGSSDLSGPLSEMEADDPSNIWGSWRKADGCLRNADYFMEKYFIHHLKNIPEIVFNLNYRYKYFVKDNVNSPKAYNGDDFDKFHGRNLAYTKYWLDGRFHILDAYFNVSQYDDMLTNEIHAPYVTSQEYKPTNNPDVYILNEIFSNNSVGNQYNESTRGDVKISAKALTPIHLKGPNNESRFLFPENIDAAKIYISINGMQTMIFGGSNLWTDIEAINQFISANSTLTINSQYLENIIGTTSSRDCGQWTINSTALKKLSLISPNYTGTLKIEPTEQNQFTNITEINISNTYINLTVNNVPVKVIKANNKPGGDLILSNLNKLDDLSLSGKFNKLSVISWKQNCSLPTASNASLDCEEITITNDKLRFPDNAITISNNQTLRDLKITGFSSITITNCPKLKNINLYQCDNLKKLSITMPPNKDKDTVLILNDGIAGEFDLTQYTELNELNITNANITKIILGDNLNVDLPPLAFSQSSSLEEIITGENTKLYLTGASTFQHCNNLSFENLPIHVKLGTISLAYTFSCQGIEKGKMTFEDVKAFFERIRADIQTVTLPNGRVVKRPPTMYVTNIREIFRNQSIEYTLEQGIEEYNNQHCSIGLSLFLRCFALDDALSNNNIAFLNRYMLCEVDESCGETFRLGHTLVDNSGNYVRKTMNINNFSTVATTIDLLDDIIQDCVGLQCQNTTFQFVNNEGIPLKYVKLNDFFTASNTKQNYINSINNFNTLNAATIDSNTYHVIFDFSELFNSPKYDAEIHNIISEEFGDKWNAANSGIQLYKFMDGSYRIDSWKNVDYLLSNCTLKNEVYSSFGSFTAENIFPGENNALDIVKFINWDNLNAVTSLFNNGLLYNGQFHGLSDGLNMPKFVTYDDFHMIIEALLNSSNLTYVGSLFNNCVVMMNDTSEEFTLVGKDEFGKLKQFDNNTLKSISGLFTNMRISMTGMNGSDPIIISHDFMKPFRNVISYVRTFENWYFKYPLPFDFFNKRTETIEVLPMYKGTQDGRGTNVTKYTYEYINDIIDIQNCFKNVKFASLNTFKLSGIYDETGFNVNATENGEIPKRNRFTYNLDGNIIISDRAYLQNGSADIINPSYEIIDAEQAEQPGYSIDNYDGTNIMIGSSSGYLRNIPKEYIDGSGCFITPDILYGIGSGGYFTDAFIRDKSYVNDTWRTFTGTIPPHMMSKLMNRQIGNIFSGLNIMPIHRAEYDDLGDGIDRYYVFVPDNFSNATDCSNAFNFNILFPSHGEGYREFFALLTDKSLPNMTKLSDAVMINRLDSNTDLLDGSATLPQVHLEDSELRWNLMISISQDNQINYGIDAIKFPYMRYDSILNSWQAFMYYGHLILNDDGGWNISKLYSQGSNVYNISSIDSQFNNVFNISKNIKLNAKYDNNHYFGINAGIQTYIAKSSLINCNDITSWQENYPNSFHII